MEMQRHLPFNRPTAACAVCGEEGAKACDRCRVDFYCGKAHQTQDWPRHKRGCGVYELRSDPKLGRHLVATRDIPSGTVIMREMPLVVWPFFDVVDDEQTLCVGCCALLPLDEFEECAGCGWPVCGEDCGRRPEHQPECAAFQAAGFKLRGAGSHDEWNALSVLRMSLATKDPVLGPQLRDMQSEFPPCDKEVVPPGFIRVYEQQSKEFADDTATAVSLLREKMALASLQPEEIRRWLGVLRFNSSRLFPRQANGVYAGSAKLEHACVPNVGQWALCKDYNVFNHGDLEHLVVALRDIKRGEHLTYTYQQAPFKWKAERRCELARTWLFHCLCAMCRDPTDGGLHLSAWYCAACKGRGVQRLVCLDEDAVAWQCCGPEPQPISGRPGEGPHRDRLDALRGAGRRVPLSEWEAFLREAMWPRGLLHATSEVVLQAKEAMIKYEPKNADEAELLAGHCRDLLAAIDTLCKGHIQFRWLVQRRLDMILRVWLFGDYDGRRGSVVQARSRSEIQKIKQHWFDLLPDMKRCAITPMEKDHLEKQIKRVKEYGNI